MISSISITVVSFAIASFIARTSAPFPVARLVAVMRARTRAPASARSPTQSNALCRTNSSGQRSSTRPDHTILVEHDRVVERRALDQPLRAQRLDLVHEAERPRAGQLLRERLSRVTR